MNTPHHTVALCGATGFIGSHLRDHFNAAGYRIVPLGREFFTDSAAGRLADALSGCDTAVNVAGAPIDRRWSKAYKRKLFDSRIGTTRRLVAAMERTDSIRCCRILPFGRMFRRHGGCRVGRRLSGRTLPRLGGRSIQGSRTHPYIGYPFRHRTGRLRRRFRTIGPSRQTGNGRRSRQWPPTLYMDRHRRPLSGDDAVDRVARTGGNLQLRRAATPLDGGGGIARPAPLQGMVSDTGLRPLRLLRGEAADLLLKGQCARPLRLLDAGFEFHTPELQLFLERLR